MDVRKFTAAAWLPAPNTVEAHEHGWAAVEHWIREQEKVAGAPSVLLTCDFQVDDHGLLGTYRRGSTHYSAKAGGPPTSGPVFVHHPTRRAMRAAQDMALSAICVWEHPSDPVLGWAGQVHAVDLVTGQPTRSAAALAEHLDRLLFAGNNGYADRPGARDARHILAELRDEDLLGEDIPGALAAYEDISVAAQDRIAGFIDRLRAGAHVVQRRREGRVSGASVPVRDSSSERGSTVRLFTMAVDPTGG